MSALRWTGAAAGPLGHRVPILEVLGHRVPIQAARIPVAAAAAAVLEAPVEAPAEAAINNHQFHDPHFC